MTLDLDEVSAFRRKIMAVRSEEGEGWDASRRLVEPSRLPTTLSHLLQAIHVCPLSASLKEALVTALHNGQISRLQDLPGDRLKRIAGLPATKALRALCVYFNVVDTVGAQWPVPTVSPQTVEDFVRLQRNPFDLLLEVDAPSLLELGAGDLSFASELAAHYGPSLARRQTRLTLHCLDRIQPGSQLSGTFQPDAMRLDQLRRNPSLEFRFFGHQDMFDLGPLDRSGALAARYVIATCWAPASPTFAYEPTRIAASLIHEDLRRTKGSFRTVRVGGESAIEVRHRGRDLLFPSWKFEIRGPLALLNLLASRGTLCVLGAVDSQVFWEVLSQLLADPDVRLPDRIFTSQQLPRIFGPVYNHLSALRVGESVILSDLAEIRRDLPATPYSSPHSTGPVNFRFVEIRRGAVFEGMPASSTARRFDQMGEETPPWYLVLVPGRPPVT